MNELYIVIGAYGSGKSEYSIHLAQELNEAGKDVVLVDMDVVNPYFRSREVRDEFAAIGIEVVALDGSFSHADLPMISPRIMGMVQNLSKTVILDVGGDPAGCRTLGRFVDAINAREHKMQLVINTMRPFTSNVQEITAMKQSLEFSSKLKVTELICNTNLMEYTEQDVVAEGIRITQEAAELLKLEFKRYLVLDQYDAKIEPNIMGKDKIVMRYMLKKPWEQLLARGI